MSSTAPPALVLPRTRGLEGDNVNDFLYKDGTDGLARIADMATLVTKKQRVDGVVYHVVVDPKQYEQAFPLKNDRGAAQAGRLDKVTLGIAFDKDGHLVKVDEKLTMPQNTLERKAAVSLIDKTTTDSMPPVE